MRDGDMCLGVSGQTPLNVPTAPWESRGRWSDPSGSREDVQELTLCLEIPGYGRPPRRGAGGLHFSSGMQRNHGRSQSGWITLSSFSLPSLWLRFPPVPCLQGLRSHRRTGGCLQTLRSTQQRGAEPPQGAAPAAWACWSNEQHPEKKTQSRGGAGENKAQVGEERAGKGAS